MNHTHAVKRETGNARKQKLDKRYESRHHSDLKKPRRCQSPPRVELNEIVLGGWQIEGVTRRGIWGLWVSMIMAEGGGGGPCFAQTREREGND